MKMCIKIVEHQTGQYVAHCPSLPGCACRGDSWQEAYDKLEDAIRGYLAAVGDVVHDNVIQEVVSV